MSRVAQTCDRLNCFCYRFALFLVSSEKSIFYCSATAIFGKVGRIELNSTELNSSTAQFVHKVQSLKDETSANVLFYTQLYGLMPTAVERKWDSSPVQRGTSLNSLGVRVRVRDMVRNRERLHLWLQCQCQSNIYMAPIIEGRI